MKNIYFILIFGITLIMSSCYKEETWVDKNVKEGGKFFPKIASFKKITTGNDFYFGDEIVFEMNFWSQDKIAAEYILENEEEYDRIPYQSAYSYETHMDSVLLTYKAHEINAKSITIKGKVKNENELEKISSSSYELTTCPKDLKTVYSSTGTISYEVYINIDTLVSDTLSIDTTFSDVNIVLTKLGDNKYNIDDLTLGFAKIQGGGSLKGVDLYRDICHFSSDTTFNDSSADDTIFYKYSMTGIVRPDKVVSIDWHIDITSSSGNISGTMDGKSDLK